MTTAQEHRLYDRLLPGQRLPAVKKVLFVIDTLQTGGAEQSLLETVTRFKRTKAIVCHLYAGDRLKPQFIEKGVAVHSIALQKKYGLISAYRKLRTLVKAERPDLIVACLTRSEIVSRMVGRHQRIPVVGTLVSDLYAKAYNHSLSARARVGVAFFRWLNRLTANYCKAFIANSEAIKKSNAVQLRLPVAKIEVINRGRDSSRFVFLPRSAFPGKPVRFLNIGRLVSVKGQRDLILAFHAFGQVCPCSVLHIAGEGPERPALEALIKELGLGDKVELLGNRTDLPQLMPEYDCFVLPSRSEGFSGAVVEAMLSGLPVLASNIPANKEVMEHLVTGYLFQQASVAAITNAMDWYYHSRPLAHAMALQAYEHAKQHFELEQIVTKTERYLQQLMANSA